MRLLYRPTLQLSFENPSSARQMLALQDDGLAPPVLRACSDGDSLLPSPGQ